MLNSSMAPCIKNSVNLPVMNHCGGGGREGGGDRRLFWAGEKGVIA